MISARRKKQKFFGSFFQKRTAFFLQPIALWVTPGPLATSPAWYYFRGGRYYEISMANTVTSKGQVTIPKPVRDRLGIVPGDAVDFKLAPDGSIVLVKMGAASVKSRFEAIRGCADAGLSTDEIMALTRGAD